MILFGRLIPLLSVLLAAFPATLSLSAAEDDSLRPWSKDPSYWSYHGEPVLLLGGSDDDNLFQWPAEKLIPQLDRIAEAGGNVVRNTMSDRKEHGRMKDSFEEYPFLRLANGKYDLNQWNPEYWRRFERLLSETAERKIVVQIEIWDRFDYSDHASLNHPNDHNRWQLHPYNPVNNINYTFEESGLDRQYLDHPLKNKQPFFFTTPQQRDNQIVFKYQQRFVNRLLDDSLKYDHVLYCMDNETKAEAEWGASWARLVRQRADEAGRLVMVTEMWDDWDLQAGRHRQTFDHPDLYNFVDVSQNNQNSGQPHWDNFLFVRKYLSQQPRPMNTTKTYGADGNKFGHTDQDAIERFWRHLLAGAASIRFHRPPAGLGINEKAVACIQAARKLEQRIKLWTVDPTNDLLSDRADNEAYLAASKNHDAFVLYFPNGEKRGSVKLDLSQASGRLRLEWIDIDLGTGDSGKQGASVHFEGGQKVTITAPSAGNLVAVITKITRTHRGTARNNNR